LLEKLPAPGSDVLAPNIPLAEVLNCLRTSHDKVPISEIAKHTLLKKSPFQFKCNTDTSIPFKPVPAGNTEFWDVMVSLMIKISKCHNVFGSFLFLLLSSAL